MTTYNQLNYKCLCFLIKHFYSLVLFHTQRPFFANLSVRVSDSGHYVTYATQFCTNKPVQNIYRCMPSCSTQHYTLLYNHTIIHTKTNFEPFCHSRNKITSETKLSHYSLIHPRSPHTSLSTSNKIQT